MWRTRAVQRMLVEEVAGLRPHGRRWRSDQAPDADERPALEREAMSRARRQALVVVALAWVALAVLITARQASGSVLQFGGEEAIFSLGLLAVAVFSGFRLGQWEKVRAVERLYEELAVRSPEE